MWLADYGFDTADCHDEELRVGENSREKCWERFVSLHGWKRENIPINNKTNAEMIPNSTKETCKSISQEPLLPGISIDKFNGEPLHIYQGKLTHQNSKTFMKLNKESENAEGEYFYEQAELCQQYIIDTLELSESVEFKDAKKNYGKIRTKMKKVMAAVTAAEENGDEREIEAAENELEQLQIQLKDTSEESNYGFNACLIKGAKEFDKMIDSSENNKNTRMTKQAFLFRSAIRLYAGFFTAMYVYIFMLMLFRLHLLLIFNVDKVAVVEVNVRS